MGAYAKETPQGLLPTPRPLISAGQQGLPPPLILDLDFLHDESHDRSDTKFVFFLCLYIYIHMSVLLSSRVSFFRRHFMHFASRWLTRDENHEDSQHWWRWWFVQCRHKEALEEKSHTSASRSYVCRAGFRTASLPRGVKNDIGGDRSGSGVGDWGLGIRRNECRSSAVAWVIVVSFCQRACLQGTSRGVQGQRETKDMLAL